LRSTFAGPTRRGAEYDETTGAVVTYAFDPEQAVPDDDPMPIGEREQLVAERMSRT
jgi:hypothetical protein